MTYIELINDFWQEFEDEAMRPNDALLYLYLLKVCNSKGWENPFELTNKRVRLCLEITDKAIIESRDRLVGRGLIEVTKGERNRTAPTYKLLRLCFPTESKKGSKRESKKETKSATNAQQNGSKKGNIIIDLDKDKEKEYVVVADYAREKFLQNFFSEDKRRSLEELCMSMHTDIATMRRLAEAVLNEWETTDEPTHPDMNRAKQHLVNQIRIKLNAERAAQRSQMKQTNLNRRPEAPRKANSEWDNFDINSIPTA